MLKKWFLALMLVLSNVAYANDWAIGTHIGSIHVPQRDFNNVNPGLYARVNDWQFGVFNNSFKDTSFYAGRHFAFGKYEVLLGGATGYDTMPIQVTLALSRAYQIDGPHYIRPAVLGAWSQGKPAAVIHFMYEYKFKEH